MMPDRAHFGIGHPRMLRRLRRLDLLHYCKHRTWHKSSSYQQSIAGTPASKPAQIYGSKAGEVVHPPICFATDRLMRHLKSS
eukprot:COSAG01_NODE_57891_length_309_cov_1.038095_1_plen_81_part_01